MKIREPELQINVTESQKQCTVKMTEYTGFDCIQKAQKQVKHFLGLHLRE